MKQCGNALYYASNELRNDKEIILAAIVNYSNACKWSLLEGYQDFNEIVEKEGEDFLFSCWNNRIGDTRLQVAQHCNFLPTQKQTGIGLMDNYVRQIYQLRKDEWFAIMEESKLKSTIEENGI